MALDPEVRLERFLDGQNLTPAVRLEYFLAGAAGYGLAALQDKSLTIGSGGTSLASIPDGANNVPIQSLVVAIDAVQEGTGDPSPDNIRPISGHTGAKLHRTGKNLLELSNESNPNRDSYSYSSETPQKIVATKTAAGGTFVARFLASLKANVSYTLSADINNIVRVYVYSDELWGTSVGSITTPFPKTFTPTKDGTYVFGFYGSDASGTVQSVENAMLRLSSDLDTSYELYEGDTYSVTFTDQGTVYGGTYDFVSGKLRVEWVNIASYNGETITEPWISSMDVYSAGATPTTGAQVVYKLAAPIELDLTPATIYTRPGVNNIWASTGNVVAVEYKQGPEAAANEIKSIIAPVLPEMKADANLVANDFRIVGNTLYKITANIAAGGTLTPGSNCTATTVAAQLKALL